jgi:hypothetical protein
MKTTSSIPHLTDTQYLVYFIKLHNISIEQYHEYNQKLSPTTEQVVSNILREHSINILPYLFSSKVVDHEVFNKFLLYCSRYIKLPSQNCENDTYLLNVFDGDVGGMVTMLLLMQYYFL